jgi:glycerol-3-phosphate dehydrogenase (NAD(P)+)
MQQTGMNARYLPGIELPKSLRISSEPLSELLYADGKDRLFVVATPMAGLRSVLTFLADVDAPLVWLCKGFEAGTGLMPHEVQNQVAPGLKAGVLSGPSFALEVAREQATALVAASPHAMVRDAMVRAFHSPSLRIYANQDMVGVEVG